MAVRPQKQHQCHRRSLCRLCLARSVSKLCGQTCVDSSTSLILMDSGKFVCMAHSPVAHEALGIRPTDQSCNHEGWILRSNAMVKRITKDTKNDTPSRKNAQRRTITTNQNASDHSLSSKKATIRRRYIRDRLFFNENNEYSSSSDLMTTLPFWKSQVCPSFLASLSLHA